VKDLLGIDGEDLVGHAAPNGFGEDNKVSTDFPGVGLESGFAGVGWKPGKVRAISGVVNSGGLDFSLVDLIKKITIWEDVLFRAPME
jgi:hypothetical protein